ncbi:MAG: TIGR02266 family protein [Polyangiaceae bacterium]|nr:TIGR02266 family protein [Polyangiaceae bacterium]
MGSSDLSSERRNNDRAPIELKVEYRRVNTFFSDYTKNISRGGTFVGTTRPLPVDTEFVFALGIPGLAEPLRLLGKVIWATSEEDATPANPAGMGIEFQYKDDAERLEKERQVEVLMCEQLGELLAAKLLGRSPHGAKE